MYLLFQKTLLVNVQTFQHDVDSFSAQYDEQGPMVTGLPPREASDRLIIFQNRSVTSHFIVGHKACSSPILFGL